jgi:hypothetical protein
VKCPNIAIIAFKLKLSHTTPTPNAKALHDLFQPLAKIYAHACRNLSGELVGGVHVENSKKKDVAFLDKVTFEPVVVVQAEKTIARGARWGG